MRACAVGVSSGMMKIICQRAIEENLIVRYPVPFSQESAGKVRRGPISKQRNANLQWVLIQAAHLAPRFNETLANVYEKECARGPKNRATLAVARKLVAWLLAVDKSGHSWVNTKTKMN